MSIFRSFVMAFSSYSISPKSKMEKNRENCSYILLFIPLIGAIIGVCINRWGVAYPYLCNSSVLPAVFGSVLPLFLSGGAHLDGFFRTVDALCSHKPKEGKLRILKEDSHVGYFAIIVCVIYLMVSIGVWSEMPIEGFFLLGFQYVISRSIYGLSILLNKHADEGLADIYIPESMASRAIQVICLLAYIAISAFWMILINRGVGIACVVGAIATYIYYIVLAKKDFGGITEELGGFFVTVCEVIIPIAALIRYWF